MRWLRMGLTLALLGAGSEALSVGGGTSLLSPAKAISVPTGMGVRSGDSIHLIFQFSLQQALLNREAPNRLRFQTPWGDVAAQPRGKPQPAGPYASYFRSVDPLTLSVQVPSGTRPGVYPLRLTGELFVCHRAAQVCVRREISRSLTLRVLSPGSVASALDVLVVLTDADLLP